MGGTALVLGEEMPPGGRGTLRERGHRAGNDRRASGNNARRGNRQLVTTPYIFSTLCLSRISSRIFYPTKIRTSYFARIFYPTKIRATYSVRIIFIRRILERSRFRPARISSVYVVPGSRVSRVPSTSSSVLSRPPAPLRSNFPARFDDFPWLVVIIPCTLSRTR